MSIANKKELEKCLDEVIRPFGFVKRRSTWHRKTLETVLVLDLQKFDYAGRYFVNLGVSVRGLSDDEYPPEEKCHLRTRLDRIYAERESVLRAFDLENTEFSSEEREPQIKQFIILGMNWLDTLSSVQAIAEQVKDSQFLRNRTTVQLKRFLNINSGS